MEYAESTSDLILAFSGLDADLSEEEQAIQNNVHRFAEEVMRPLAAKMDRLSAEEAIAPGSPIYEFYEQYDQLGIDFTDLLDMDPAEGARLRSILLEELSWGDVGLTTVALVHSFPGWVAKLSGNQELMDRFLGTRGCWLITQPDRGSDCTDTTGDLLPEGSRQNRPNLIAEIEGDVAILNGQSSAWISAAPLADTALAMVPADYGDGLYRENGTTNGITLLIPLDLEGVSKGKPLEKMGQRTLPQGEIFFDNVRVPLKYAIAGQDQYYNSVFSLLVEANQSMGSIWLGAARASFEHAITYCHERRQGGRRIIEHQSVMHRLFEMFRKIEAARALNRRVSIYNVKAPYPHKAASILTKITSTETAAEVAAEALQLFGGNGLTHEYPVEKLMRDARSSLIEDGENNILGLHAFEYIARAYDPR
jgi:acyl-CoA dehydrogenase